MDTSRNAPCPCGSGKKYKRCCLGKAQAAPAAANPRAPRGLDDARLERVQLQVIGTMDLPAKLDWTDFDFEVDLFDPVLDDLHELIAEAKEGPSDEDLLLLVAKGLVRHTTLEVRARCAEELERRLASIKSRKVVEDGELAMGALVDEDWPAPSIGLLLNLYNKYILHRLLARGDRIVEEERALDTSLVQQAQAAAKSGTQADFEELARRIAPLGAGAMPYLEHAVYSNGLDESIRPLVEIAARHPSVRSARILCLMLEEAEVEPLLDLLFEAMSRMPEHAWPLLLYRVRDRRRPAWDRLDAAMYLVRASVAGVYEPLVEDLWREHRDEEDWEDDMYEDVAEQLADLGDRRAVGNVIHHAHEGEIPKEALAALEKAWRGNGWWAEVREGLETLRRGGRVLVREGEEFHDVVKEDFASAPPQEMTSAQFRMGVVQEDWNHAYHEETDWLRPSDLAGAGPREADLMRQYVDFAHDRISQMPREPQGAEVVRTFARLEDEWMTTPQIALGGRTPLALILEEKLRTGGHPAYFRKYLRRKLSSLCDEARIALAGEDVGTALRYLRVVLDVEPNHPVARRLIAKTR